MGFGAYAVPCDADNFEGRATVVLSLLLTTVAFKLVITDMLPKVSYLTFLDQYLYSGFITLAAIFAQSVVCLSA